jgi:hypothetical protein
MTEAKEPFSGEHEVSRKAIAHEEFMRKKPLQINAIRLDCSHLCRDPMLIRLRRETWGHVDGYRAL